MHKEKIFLLAIGHFNKFGCQSLKKIAKYFGGFQNAWQANNQEWFNCGLNNQIIEEFIHYRKNTNPELLVNQLNTQRIKTITIFEDHYPKLLKEINQSPVIIYYRGNIEILNKKLCLAVVGTRKYSPYGQQVSEMIISQLVQADLTIVSGLALGIDTLAHQITLDNNGITVAVLGSGVDQQSIYPATNRRIAENIIDKGGAIISEYPPGTLALKYHFPQRNRLIAGLSIGTLIIEAAKKSGSLITAALALEFNREVFAIPGSIFSESSYGTNDLIKQGAKLVNSADDILENLGLNIKEKIEKNTEQLNKVEQNIYQIISNQSIHINELARQTKLDINELNATLMIMEIKGYIKNIGGMNFVRQ